MKAVIPAMRRIGGGAIVNISSISEMLGTKESSNVAYCASKWAVRGMSKLIVAQFGADGVRCKSVHPGYILTPMMIAATDEQGGGAAAAIPLGRLAQPEEVSNLVLGAELTATLLFEVEDQVRRDNLLRKIGEVEKHITIQLGDDRIAARTKGDVQRTRESDGKASAVHFFHFDFAPAQVAAWASGEGPAMLVIDHPEYGYAALFSADTRAFLERQCFE